MSVETEEAEEEGGGVFIKYTRLWKRQKKNSPVRIEERGDRN
jgi:hypothetical protein